MTDIYSISTQGEVDIIDLTQQLVTSVKKHGVKRGVATLFVQGSTAAITTIEHDPSLLEDFRRSLTRLVPRDGWGHPENAHSHIRASLIGCSISVPIVDGEPMLGTWQQPVLVELDTRPRSRKVAVAVSFG